VLRLGVLPAGYLSPKAARAVREVLRKRAHVVRQHTAHVLSVQNIMARHTGLRCSVKHIHACTKHDLEGVLPEANQVLAVTSRLALLDCLSPQSKTLEQAVTTYLQHPPAYEQLVTVDGIGTIVAQTIGLATGAMSRFPTVGNSAAYGRCVKRTKISNGTRTGQGNVKNGHPSLEWAYTEAAQCASRFNPTGPRLYQRKHATSHLRVARKAVAPTRSRACSDSMRDLVPFEVHTAFG